MCSSAIYNSILFHKDAVNVDFAAFDQDLLDALADGYFALDISEEEEESSFDTTFCQGWIDFPEDSTDSVDFDLVPFDFDISAISYEAIESSMDDDDNEEEWKDLSMAIELQRLLCL